MCAIYSISGNSQFAFPIRLASWRHSAPSKNGPKVIAKYRYSLIQLFNYIFGFRMIFSYFHSFENVYKAIGATAATHSRPQSIFL